MKRGSWLYSWGILVVYGIPILVQGGEFEGIVGVLVAAILTVFGEYLLYRCLHPDGVIQKIGSCLLLFLGLFFAVLGMVRVAEHYSDAIRSPWILLIMSLIALSVGLRGNPSGRKMMVKVFHFFLLAGIVFVLVFQLPNLPYLYGNQAQAFDYTSGFEMGCRIFAIQFPISVAKIRGREYSIGNTLLSWGLFLATVLMLLGMWENKVLQAAKVPYLLLGQTGRTPSGNPMPMEALNFMLVIVSLYCSARICLEEIGECFMKKDICKYGRTMGITLLAGVMAALFCTGCAPKLSEKELVFVGDERDLMKEEKYQELSCMKLLIIRTPDIGQIMPYVLAEPNLSYEIFVAYGNEVPKDYAGDGTKMSLSEYVTIRELLNSCYTTQEIRLPKLELRDGNLIEVDQVIYKNGKLID